MDENDKIACTDEKSISKLFVGRSIVAASDTDGTLTLDNGEIIMVEPVNSCCAIYSLEAMAKFENVITKAKVRKVAAKDGKTITYRLFVYGAGVKNRGEVVNVTGTDGSGNYGTGFTLDILAK